MIIKELNKTYQTYIETGKAFKLSDSDHGDYKKDTFMFHFSKDFLNQDAFKDIEEINTPLIKVYKLCRQNRYFFGTSIQLSFSIFLITLNGSFLKKFENFLNTVIFEELKKHRIKKKIGGVGCFDLVYNGPIDDLKYFIIFDKEWDHISIDIYSNLFINAFSSEEDYYFFVFKIRDYILKDCIFLEENEKESKLTFYKHLYDHYENNFFFYICYHDKIGYYPTGWWNLHGYFRDYVKEYYRIEESTTNEYLNIICNNKFITKWSIYYNDRPMLLSAYKNESLEDIYGIYEGLGIQCRIMLNDAFLNGFKHSDIVSDIALTKESFPLLMKSAKDARYNPYTQHDNGALLYPDVYLETSSDYDNLNFLNLLIYNNYGDITGPVYPDHTTPKSVSFLSSIRSPTTLNPKPLDRCVHSSAVPVIEHDLYDEIQLKIPEYDIRYNSGPSGWEHYGIDKDAFYNNNLSVNKKNKKIKKMINKIVTIYLLCFTIIIFELFFIYLNQKNVINPFYVKLLFFLLSPEKFSIFFDNSMVLSVDYLNVSSHLVFASFLCFIYNILIPKLNRNLPILYNCSLLFLYIYFSRSFLWILFELRKCFHSTISHLSWSSFFFNFYIIRLL